MKPQNVSLEGKTILVTGAAGFIGSNLVLELLRTTTTIHIAIYSGSYISTYLIASGLVPTKLILPPDVKIETTFFSEKIFQHHTMQLPSKTAQKKNL